MVVASERTSESSSRLRFFGGEEEGVADLGEAERDADLGEAEGEKERDADTPA